MQKILVFLLALSYLTSCTSVQQATRSNLGSAKSTAPKNIIFMIVDGMGFEYVKAARIYNGQKALSYENFPCKTRVATCAYEGSNLGKDCVATSNHITDSAAAATALATGVKVNNGVVSRAIPGNNTNIQTILELAKSHNKSTGIISTKLFTDATPAAFAGHADKRKHTEEILRSIFEGSTPHVIFGADTPMHRKYAHKSKISYEFVSHVDELNKLADKIAQGSNCEGSRCAHIYGGFGQQAMIPGAFHKEDGLLLEIASQEEFDKHGVPHLNQMTDAALKILHKNSNGFFLMVESSMPDMIGHKNQQFDESDVTPSAIAVLVREMMEVENTINILQDFVTKNPDTLLILTADHETGGLIVEDEKTDCLGEPNCLASVRWTSQKYEPENKDSLARHTGVDVPLYAVGTGSERFCHERINNIDIKNLALGLETNLTAQNTQE